MSDNVDKLVNEYANFMKDFNDLIKMHGLKYDAKMSVILNSEIAIHDDRLSIADAKDMVDMHEAKPVGYVATLKVWKGNIEGLMRI